MARYVKKEFSITSANWTAPAGVTNITVSIFDLDNLKSITGTHSLSLKSNKTLWTWGTNTNGQLGDNTIVEKSSPVAIVGGHSFIKISCGNRFSAGLKSDGSIWTWGLSDQAQLGDNTYFVDKSSPVPVVGGHSFISVVAGYSHSIALKADGSAWTWGVNFSGELGDGTVVRKSSPVAVIGGHSFVEISATDTGSYALKADGSVWSWGANSAGYLGDNTTVAKSSPVAVVGGHSFVSLSGTLALKSDGSAWGWGINNSGEIGDGTVGAKSSPVPVIGGHRFVQVSKSMGNGFVIALKADGSAWGWGYNTYGELGDGTTLPKSSPVPVIGGHTFVNVKAGRASAGTGTPSIATKSNASAWTWGGNVSGVLGDGTVLRKSSPVAVIGGHLFETKPVIITQKTISVTPGTTYTFNTFLTEINTQVLTNTSLGNNLTIVIEYTV